MWLSLAALKFAVTVLLRLPSFHGMVYSFLFTTIDPFQAHHEQPRPLSFSVLIVGARPASLENLGLLMVDLRSIEAPVLFVFQIVSTTMTLFISQRNSNVK